MSIIDKIILLENNFIKRYKDVNIDNSNIDYIEKDIEIFDLKREELIKSIVFEDLKLTEEELHYYIQILSNNQNEIVNIANKPLVFHKKKLSSISKEKRMNAYSPNYYTESKFINIKK